MPFIVAQMDVEMTILSEAKTNIIWYHSYVESNF